MLNFLFPGFLFHLLQTLAGREAIISVSLRQGTPRRPQRVSRCRLVDAQGWEPRLLSIDHATSSGEEVHSCPEAPCCLSIYLPPPSVTQSHPLPVGILPRHWAKGNEQIKQTNKQNF